MKLAKLHIHEAVVIVAAVIIAAVLWFPQAAFAIDSASYHTTLSPSAATVGEEVTLTVSLDGYTSEVDQIRGLQIDITNVDPNILDVVEYTSLINDSSAPSNTASYNEANKRVRLVYVLFNGTLTSPYEDVFKVVFRVKPGLEKGSITLPVTLLMQTESNQQLTLKSECNIAYSASSPSVNTVEIEWGALNYAYSSGVWNVQSHTYDNAGWQDQGSGYITVRNISNAAVSAGFAYATDRTDISGSFFDGSSVLANPLTLQTGQEKTIKFMLSGKPSEPLDNAKIGRITVAIGGE